MKRSFLCLALVGCLVRCGGSDGGDNDVKGGFKVSGKVARGNASALTAADAAANVTHVMAVNPSSGASQRLLSKVESNGSFSLDLTPGRPWVLVFVDSTKIGKDMVVAVFKANALDSVPPAVEGGADLGEVTTTDGEATSGIAYGDLLAALGIDEATAALVGAIDDVCLRYTNPDIDADGVIDVNQDNRGFMLDFHTHFAMRSSGGTESTIADVIGNFLPTSSTILFGGTGIYVAYPSSYDSSDPLTSGSVTFPGPVHYSSQGPGGATHLIATAGVPVSGGALTVNGFGDYRSFGVSADAGFDIPAGEYDFGVNGKTLTFTNVQTRTDAELAAAQNFIMPFIRFNKTEPSCVSACTIASVDYEWRKRATASWVPATAEEVALVVNDNGAFISVYKDYDNGTKRFTLTVPMTSTSGNLAWADARLEGSTEADRSSLTTTGICHLGLSYDDKLGLRMFSGVGNAPGTCPMQ